MATEGSAGHGPANASEYIVHHLGHLNTSGHPQKAIIDFSIVNIDTVFWSVAMALLAAFLMYRAAKLVTSGVPGRFVGAIESVVEFVHEQARSIVHGDVSKIAPLALAAFIWIVFMNTLDLLPVDLVPWLLGLVGISYQRIVPTADLNGTMSLSLVVLGTTLYYGVKIKGGGGFVHELFTAPFGAGPSSGIGIVLKPVLWVVNFGMQIIEYLARAVSLGMRLFGNMFAGELVFMLIALLGATATVWGFGLHFVMGLAWAIFHILIIVLQAFIFMMLTLVYIGQAHEHH
ncbi:MAG: F0F1 ATP synthase subunit A [Lautropia sp.]|nr:F0F1 ATP synthase subunit A [Lautropia sp.]